ncbi:uncharacterized protein LOC109401778 [Aedes albopictus]|uniref:UBA domain-containing protein n=1 Tax=Aedes albopictus TaxID=7160 RepID=A0ABM1Y253_AEDAL
MSHSPPNYMDGVPVKISERFKPPPKITVPQSVINRLAHAQSGGGTVRATTTASYDFELEATVLKRITEWRAAKERERYEREERVRLKEQERARLAEEEQKRKLNQISYPNTDDLSSASDGEGEGSEEENDESSPSGSSEERIQQNQVSSLVVSSSAVPHSHMNKFDTILMPTVLPDVATSAIGSTEKAIDSSKPLHFSIPKNTNLLNNNNSIYNKINYSDFENDTSSPFDNMELKTINDLDILAQVYNLDISNSGSERSPGDSNENDSKTQDKPGNVCSTTQENEESVEQKPTVVPSQSLSYQMQSHYQPAAFTQNSGQEVQSNDYYKSYGSYNYSYGGFVPSSTPSNTSYATPDSRFLSQYQSTAGPSYQQPVQSQYQSYNQGIGSYNYFPYTSSSNSTATQSTYASAYFYNSTYGHQSQPAPNYSNYAGNANAAVAETAASGCTPGMEGAPTSDDQGSSSMRSKSKSVPDIVRQLDEEVKSSAQRRTRNNSQSVADSNSTEEKCIAKSDSTQDFTLYNRLSPTDQNLVKRIGSMGFPLERVAAVLARIGNDDKKIVEHLIPLSELLDLGFEEEKISEALVKFDNNKHKALDYLIS